MLCNKIKGKSPQALAVKAVCFLAINLYINRIRKAFIKARNSGKCTETKFRIIGPAIVTAKVVKC